MRILLVLTDFLRWKSARHWSYNTQLAFEQAFVSHGVRCDVICSPCAGRAPEITSGKRYDQVWLELVHNTALTKQWLDWFRGAAPVRVGMIAESLNHSQQDLAVCPAWAARKAMVWSRLASCTHVLAVDEVDAAEIDASGVAKAMWWPQAVPRQFVVEAVPLPRPHDARFCGAPYGSRKMWLRDERVASMLKASRSPEAGTALPAAFTTAAVTARLAASVPCPRTAQAVNSMYLRILRRLRQTSFARWMANLHATGVVVNLPHIVKAYPGRVVEAMACGRPVVACEIPERPLTRAMFEHGTDILLYSPDDPGDLCANLRRLQSDSALAQRLAESARAKVLTSHTIETRTREVLDWIDRGVRPRYHGLSL